MTHYELEMVLNITNQQGNASQNHNHLTSFRMVIIEKISIGEDVDKREPCTHLIGMQVVSALWKIITMDVTQKIKNRTPI